MQINNYLKYAYATLCSFFLDMKVEKQWFMVGNTNGAKTAGIAPNAKIVRKSFLYINVCYYWPINYGKSRLLLCHFYTLIYNNK